jgi:hypothetical protein
MTDQQLLIAAIRKAGSIIAEHLEPSAKLTPSRAQDAVDTIARLAAVLDNEDLARAIERLEKGHGLRVVK